LPGDTDDVVTIDSIRTITKNFRTVPSICTTTIPVAASAMEPNGPTPPANDPSSATVEATHAAGTAVAAPNSDDEDPVLPCLPQHLELLSLAHFDNDDIAAMNGALKGNTHYRFTFAKGGHCTYYGCRPKKGHHTPVDDQTSMFDIEMACWVPIPAHQTAPHTPEDLIEAVNDICIMDRHCIAYVHPEARNASRQPNDLEMHPLHVYNISEEEEAVLVAGLKGSEAAYKFQRPWEEGHTRHEGSWPREGVPNAADRRTEMWDDERQKYRMLADSYTVPHDPQDYVDAINFETVRAEKLHCTEIRGAARRLRSGNNGKKQV